MRRAALHDGRRRRAGPARGVDAPIDDRARARGSRSRPGSRSRSRPATRARCGRARGSRAKHGVTRAQLARHDRQRLPRRGEGAARQPRRASRSSCSRATAIAQLVIAPVVNAELEEADELDDTRAAPAASATRVGERPSPRPLAPLSRLALTPALSRNGRGEIHFASPLPQAGEGEDLLLDPLSPGERVRVRGPAFRLRPVERRE